MTDLVRSSWRDESLPLAIRLDAARQEIQELDGRIAEIRAAVADLVQAEPLNEDQTATLYWEYEDIVPAALLGKFHDIKDMLEQRCPWTYPCQSCGADQPLTSRTALKELQRHVDKQDPQLRGYLCQPCREVRDTTSAQRWQEQQAAYRRRLHELKTMPYRQYLLSPEWQERRLARLKAAKYGCQVCNVPARQTLLNVHHRTYVRRGEEYARDLIVLCEDCHHLFHRNGSLAPHPEDV